VKLKILIVNPYEHVQINQWADFMLAVFPLFV